MLPLQPHFQRVLSQKLAENIRKSRFSLQNVLLSNFEVKILNQHLKIDPCSKWQVSRTKIQTRTENGQILGLLVTKF